jgi:DNA polymerase-3 subunit epsilon
MTHKIQPALWARTMLNPAHGQTIILDTETCDLHGEVIELAIIDIDGNALYNQRFSPLTPIQPGAFRVHGLSAQMLRHEPTFAAEYDAIRDIVGAANVVLTYNAPFDVRCLEATCQWHRRPFLTFHSGCIMRQYAQFYGEWRRGQYKWQPLRGGDHSALGDARAALALLREMAAWEAVRV